MSRLNDINGKTSSKRYWANRCLTLGYFMAIFFVIIWGYGFLFIDKEFILPSSLIELWKWLMGFGSAIILGTVFEKPNK